MVDITRIEENLATMKSAGASQEEMQQYFDMETANATQEPTIGTPQSPQMTSQYGDIRNTFEGLSSNMGFGDEIKARIGAGLASGYGAITGKDVGTYDENVALSQENQRANQAQFREDSPVLAYGSEIVGSIPASILPMGAAGKLAPSAVQKLSNLYGSASGAGKSILGATGMGATGAVSGGIYGAGESTGDATERYQAAKDMGVSGAIGGMAFGAVSPAVSKGFNSLYQKAKAKFGKKAATELVEDVAQDIPTITKPDIEMQTALPMGARTGDVDLMRVEEAARQGLLGVDEQAMINQVDDRFKQGAVDAVEKLKTIEGASDEILESGFSDLQRRFKVEKKLQGRLMDSRNKAIAKSKIYTDYTKDTLGKGLKELKETPDFQVNLSKESMKPIKDEFSTLDKIINKKDIDNVNFSFLQSWRAGLNSYKQGSQESVLAKKMAGTYDNWLDNITSEAIKEGDDQLVSKIRKANSSYAGFKNKYGSNSFKGQAKAIENIFQKDALTPDQLVNMTFGNNLKGKDTTNQITKRLLAIAPEGKAREGLKQSFKTGLIQRALEGSYKGGSDSVNMGALSRNLTDLLKNRSFRDNLASVDDLAAIKSVVSDVNKFINATSRRDVYSPSGGAVLRGLDSMLSKTAGLPMMTTASSIGKKALKEGMKEPDRQLLEKSLKEYGDALTEQVKSNAKYYGSVVGGITGAKLNTQPQNKD